jgi:hypothetical protein
MLHAFGLLNALCQVPGMRSALLHASEELRKRLGGRAVSAIVPDLCAAGLLMPAGYSPYSACFPLGRLFVLTQPY